MTLEEACRLIDPATDMDALAEIEYYNGFKGKEAAAKALREASQMVVDFVRQESRSEETECGKFDIFHTPWAGKIQAAFPKAFVNMENKLIFSLKAGAYFSLKDVVDETQLKAKILEYLSRGAIKGVSAKEMKLNFAGINKLLGTSFTMQEMTDIYTYLGNGIDHNLCVQFVESGYDMTIILGGKTHE